MKPRNTILLSLLLSFLVFHAHAQWVRDAKSRAFSRSNAVATDNSGNVFTAGVFVCIVAFDADSLLNNSCGEIATPAPPMPQTDGFLAKHDENGNLLWVIHFPGSTGNKLFVNDVDTDPSGNVYVTGAYTGTLDLIAASFSNPDATTEYFIVKVQPDGTAEWAQSNSVDDLSEMSAQKIAVTQNAVYITGLVRDDFVFGATADSVGRDASFIASFDQTGAHLWTRKLMEINANGSSRGKVLEAKGDSIWVFSSFTDTLDIDGNIVSPPGTDPGIAAGVICLYNASGTLLHHTLTNTPFIEGIKLHRPDLSLYITGRAENVTGIGADTLFDNAGVRAYVSSHTLDATADLQWVVPLTAPTSAGLTGLAVDVSSAGNIFAGGTFNSTTLNGPSTTASGGGGQNGFIIKLDATGNDAWLQSFGGAADDAVLALRAPADTLIYGAGYFARYIRVAGDEIFSGAASNGFVARIDICPSIIADMISPDSTYICKRDTTLFQVTNDASYTYQWYKDGSALPGGANADLEVMQEGIYRAEITGAGCTKLTPVARLFINPLPDSVVLTNDPMENCAGDVVNLVGPIGTYTFRWFDNGSPLPATTKDLAVTGDGDYRLEVTDTLGCAILSDTFAVRFYPYPASTLTPPGGRYTLCSGNSLLLQADNSQTGMTWQWRRDDLPVADADAFGFEVTTSGIYNAVVKNAIGCETTTEADTVIVQASPVVDLNNEALPPEICDGNSLRLVTQQVIGQTYQWYRDGALIPGETDNTLDVTVSGEYAVRASNALCEKFSDTFDLVVNPVPAAVITNSAQTSICEGENYELLAQEGSNYSYEWFRNGDLLSGQDQSALSISQTGNYNLRVTNEFDCRHTSPMTTVIVNLKPPASITAGGDVTFCEGGDVELAANAGTSLLYEWVKDGVDLGGPAQRTIIVAESGSFQVRVTNSNLCSEISPAIDIEVVPYPVSTISAGGGLNTICERDSLQLVAGATGPSYEYAWLRNTMLIVNASSSTFYAKAAGNYQVITSAGSCRDTSSFLNLQVRSNPVPVITRNEAFLSIALFGDIQWFRNEEPIAGANLQSIRILEDGDYTVNVVNADGCSAWSEVVPVCLPIPEIRKTNDVLLVSIAAQEYRWEYGQIPIAGASQRQLTAQQSGDYSVVVVSNDGCIMETEPVTVCIPYPFITQDEFTGVLYAFPNPASSYQWFFDGIAIPDGNTQVHIPDQPGEYEVQVQDLEGCVSSSESFTIAPVTGIGSDIAGLRFYPNPARDLLIVEKPQEEELFLMVIDALGRNIFGRQMAEAVQHIDLTSLSPGTYTIIARSRDGTASWKLIKY